MDAPLASDVDRLSLISKRLVVQISNTRGQQSPGVIGIVDRLDEGENLIGNRSPWNGDVNLLESSTHQTGSSGRIVAQQRFDRRHGTY